VEGEAISPDGRLFATAAREVVRGKSSSQIVLQSLLEGGTVRKLPLDALDELWSIRPAGIAFTPDSAKVAALFARDGNGIIFGWSLRTTGKPFPKKGLVVPGIVQPLQPLNPPGHRVGFMAAGAGPAGGSARSLSWLAAGNALLVGGSQVIDAGDGHLIGELGATTAAIDQSPGGDNVVYLPFKDNRATVAGVAVVQLDPKMLPGGTAPAGPTTKPAAPPKR
jgi:hypothetical protein